MSTEIMKSDNVKVTDAELTMHLENLGLLKDLSTGEKNSYLQIAKAFNLNPFKREIHVSKYNGQMSIITGYEVYIKRAERTGQLDGWSVVTSGSVKENNLKATITIYRKDRQHPFVWEAEYNEFVQKTKEGVVTKFWQKATMMIKKVAISQGFRLCFSDELGGMPYTADEINDTQDVSHEVIDSASAAIAELYLCTTLDCLSEKWKKYKHLQKDPAFLAAKDQHKVYLSTSDKDLAGEMNHTEQVQQS